MWIIEALQAFGSFNFAPIAITGAVGILGAATGLIYSEHKKKPVPVEVTAE